MRPSRKMETLRRLNAWLRHEHTSGVARVVMNIVREGRAVLDYMDSKGWFVKRLPGGRLEHSPLITSADIYERIEKLERILHRLHLTPAVAGFDSLFSNALWLDIRPKQRKCGEWLRRPPLSIPADRQAKISGDYDAWLSLAVIMDISPEGNFPQRCSAPLPKGAGACGNWFVKITPTQHACSQRCRQRKREATDEYRERKAKWAKKHRKDLKDRERKGLEIVKGENRYAKRR